jgi:hypothetical protein
MGNRFRLGSEIGGLGSHAIVCSYLQGARHDDDHFSCVSRFRHAVDKLAYCFPGIAISAIVTGV